MVLEKPLSAPGARRFNGALSQSSFLVGSSYLEPQRFLSVVFTFSGSNISAYRHLKETRISG